MSDIQQLSAFEKSSRSIPFDPRQSNVIASAQFMYPQYEACPAQPYMNPITYPDAESNFSQCGPTSSTLSSAHEADALLKGGSVYNQLGLAQYGILRSDIQHQSSISHPYLH